MRTTIMVFVIACMGIAPCLAGSDPSVAFQVNVVGDVKQYVYTLTNDLDSGGMIRMLSLWMPKYGATSVTSLTCSKPGWSTGSPSIRGDIGVWTIGAAIGAEIASGEQAVFMLTTPASVPTSYIYTPSGYSYNWQWGTYSQLEFGSQLLPVPVPEPTFLLALFGGIAGLGGFVLRRRTS